MTRPRTLTAALVLTLTLAACDTSSPARVPSRSSESSQPAGSAPAASPRAPTPDAGAFVLPPTTPDCDLARAQVVVFTRSTTPRGLTPETTAELRALVDEVVRRCTPAARITLETQILDPWTDTRPPVVAPIPPPPSPS